MAEIKIEEVDTLEVSETRGASNSVAVFIKKIGQHTQEFQINDFLTNDLVNSVANVCGQILVLKRHGPTIVQAGSVTLGFCGNGAFSCLPGYQRHLQTFASLSMDREVELTKAKSSSQGPADHFSTDLSIAEAFVLLWHDDQNGRLDSLHSGISIHTILYGAVLSELLLVSKLGIDPTEKSSFGVKYSHVHVKVMDDTPLGTREHPKYFLDGVLAEISEYQSQRAPRTLKNWIELEFQSQSNDLAFEVLDSLIYKGILKEAQTKIWGFIPVSSYDTIDPAPKAALVKELKLVLLEDKVPDLFVQVLLQFVRRADLCFAFWKNPFLERIVGKANVKRALPRLINVTQWAA
mmetsp:Transcript_26727/g.52677  ORF Transcript_26727/g.52677 Transcript_26727/m.52677 type:complete len:349 (+) Transcript_26727:50-1096(+)